MANWTGKKVKALRDAYDESQKAFGERVGVDQSTISLWETDSASPRGPAVKILDQLSEAAPPKARSTAVDTASA